MVIIKNPLTILIIMVRRIEDALNNLLLMYVIALVGTESVDYRALEIYGMLHKDA
jgi:hypothetical protein